MRKFLIIFLLFIITSNFQLLTSNLFAQDKIVAIVNNEVVTQKDRDDFSNYIRIQIAQGYKGDDLEVKIQSMKKELLDKLIEDRLILQEAKKANLIIDESRIKQRIGEIKKQYSSDAEFQNALTQQGMVEADLETKIREELLVFAIIHQEIRSKVTIQPTEITDYYQKNIAEFKIPEEWGFSTLILEDSQAAGAISDELKKGESLETQAEKLKLSVEKIKARRSGQLRQDLENIVFKLKKGEITDPVRIGEKYYLFRLDNIIPYRQESLVEVQEKIFGLVAEKKMQEALIAWVEELKKRSYIKILEN